MLRLLLDEHLLPSWIGKAAVPQPGGDAVPRLSPLAWANLALKALIMALVVYGAMHSVLPQYAGKGMPHRLVVTPIALGFVAVWWWRSGKPRPFPHVPDMLIATPFLVDILGLTVDWYGAWWFDQVAHFLGWVGLAAGCGVYFSSFGITRRNTFLLAIGLGAITHILWEIFEYLSMLAGQFQLAADYGDTMQDLILSLLGSGVGGALAATVFYDRGLVPSEMIPQRPEVIDTRRAMR